MKLFSVDCTALGHLSFPAISCSAPVLRSLTLTHFSFKNKLGLDHNILTPQFQSSRFSGFISQAANCNSPLPAKRSR
ncbi:hypothetical protein BT63DRAFT_423043 [Microthyrium microscopicum]|uniref:Uncharacterized protein n=1 Tax=Microthyrium microscopicum TaxID=703497 RepID=A0A6A6UGQ3_9PEZI|nr:hypothetical protein BT63DRAFT_423043 [Microthyrium microscopicum]